MPPSDNGVILMRTQGRHQQLIPKVTLLVFRVRCGTLNSNQPEGRECVVEFSLIHFNVLIQGLSGYGMTPKVTLFFHVDGSVKIS